jgi:hypothetical protein
MSNGFDPYAPAYHLPAYTPGRLALPVCHRLRLRRMPGRFDWVRVSGSSLLLTFKSTLKKVLDLSRHT